MAEEKNIKHLNEYPEKWTLFEIGEKGVDFSLLRINVGLLEAAGHPSYPFRAGVAIPVNSFKDVGDTLYAIEDMFREKIESTNLGVEVMTITNLDAQQYVEFVFYITTSGDFEKVHEEVQVAFPDFTIQLAVNEDPDWSLYKEYTESL